MKKIAFLLILTKIAFSQSFIPNISPISNIILPGQSTSFNINYTPTGGYNASIFLQLSVPSCLNSSISLSTNSVNYPYPTSTISVNTTSTIPPGIYNLILKSYNGTLVKIDTCKLIINSSSTPAWFVYNRPNFPLYDIVVEKSLCIKNKTWFFSMCCSYGTPGGTAITSFDGKNWECWYNSTKHFVTDACGDTILKNTVPSLSPAFNLRDMASYQNDVYYITMAEIIKIDTNVSFSSIPVPADIDMWSNGMFKIRFDNFGKIWLKSLNFVYYQDINNVWQKFSLTGAPFTIGNITDFTFDNANNIWFTTGNAGIAMFNGSFWTNYTNTNSNLPFNAFNVVSKDNFGDIYVCKNSNLYKFNGTNNWTIITYDPTSTIQTGYSIAFDNFNKAHVGTDNNFYIETLSGFNKYNSSNSPLFTNNGFPISIDFDMNNNIVIGDANGGIVRYGIWDFNTNITSTTIQEINFNTYPNPTKELLTIKLSQIKNYKLELFDCLLKTIQYQTTIHQSEITLNLESLQQGVYFIKVSDDLGHSSIKKIIKI